MFIIDPAALFGAKPSVSRCQFNPWDVPDLRNFYSIALAEFNVSVYLDTLGRY